jgi:hypothetical protein
MAGFRQEPEPKSGTALIRTKTKYHQGTVRSVRTFKLNITLHASNTYRTKSALTSKAGMQNLPLVTSDQNTVVLLSRQRSSKRHDHGVDIMVRRNYINSSNLLVNALNNYNRHKIGLLPPADQKAEYFNNCIITHLNFHLTMSTMSTVVHHTTDKL